jgi:hypothetical protein
MAVVNLAAKHQQQMLDKDTHYQSEILAMTNQFNARELAQLEAKRLADEHQLLRDEAIQSARVAERSEYETTTARILLEMHQMMTAIAPSTITMQQQTTATPQRVTAPQSLPSRIFDMEMEDTSQLTNALSGPQVQDPTMKSEEDGVFSPPRISKKRPKSAPVETRSTEETQESTNESANESMEIGNTALQDQEATIDPHHDVPLFSGAAPYAEALANFAPQDHEQETHQDHLKTIDQTREPQEQQAILYSEVLPLFPGTGTNAGALEKFSQRDKGQEEPQVPCKTIVHPIYEPQEQDPAASVDLPLFSGTAPHAEAMEKDQGQEATQVSPKEIEQLIAKYQEADRVDNEDLPLSPNPLTNAETTATILFQEDLPLFSGTVTKAEATAKFLSQENWLYSPQGSTEEITRVTKEPQEQESTEATDDLLLFTGAAPNAEALANFLQEDQREPAIRVELKEIERSTSEAQDQVDFLNTEDRNPRFSAGTQEEALSNFAQMAHYDDDDSDIQEMQAWGVKFLDETQTHPEDKQLERIWSTKVDSADRSDRTGNNKGATEDAAQITGFMGRGNEGTGRDKRQRDHANSKWREAIKRGAKGNSAAIVQQVSEPRLTIESPDRKKRAAPSPKRGEPKDDDESSMSSAVAEDLANAVLNQIQEAPAEAIAPTGPRRDA